MSPTDEAMPAVALAAAACLQFMPPMPAIAWKLIIQARNIDSQKRGRMLD
ncbi:MAG TPA: hypothetical protein VM074_02340 [Solimonas sp.]|nr:hypothetical protein [Solimonas sp.]